MSGKPVYLSDSAKDLKNFAGNHRLMAVKAKTKRTIKNFSEKHTTDGKI